KQVALPEAERLIDSGRYGEAFPLLYRALQILPRDPALVRLRREICHPFSIRTNPPGARVYMKQYGKPDDAWLFVGEAPGENLQVPVAFFRWKFIKPGYRTVEGAAGIQANSVAFVLDPEGSAPPDMVHVPNGIFRWQSLRSFSMGDFWIDKYEVTNRQFKDF